MIVRIQVLASSIKKMKHSSVFLLPLILILAVLVLLLMMMPLRVTKMVDLSSGKIRSDNSWGPITFSSSVEETELSKRIPEDQSRLADWEIVVESSKVDLFHTRTSFRYGGAISVIDNFGKVLNSDRLSKDEAQRLSANFLKVLKDDGVTEAENYLAQEFY